MRTLLWSLIIVVAVLAVSSSVYTCGYQQDRLEYVLTDEMIVTNSNLKASEHATDNGDEHVMQTHIKPGRLTGLFNDSNAMQLEAARANGIDPITDVRSAFKLKRPIVRLYTCDVYYIDSTMKYAHPYLVPKAANSSRWALTASVSTPPATFHALRSTPRLFRSFWNWASNTNRNALTNARSTCLANAVHATAK